jgi:hypothetical protein
MRRCFILPLALASLTAAPADDRPLALQVLESELAKEIATKTSALNAKYHKALEKLKADFTKEGDLESILSVKAEIVRLENSKVPALTLPGRPDRPAIKNPQPAVPSTSASGSIALKPNSATPEGNVRFDSDIGLLVGWKKAGGASWTIPAGSSGSYHMTLEYYSGPFAGGRISIDAGSLHKEIAITGSGKWDDHKSLDLGTVNLDEGAGKLKVTILESRTQGVMELQSLELTPIKRPSGG